MANGCAILILRRSNHDTTQSGALHQPPAALRRSRYGPRDEPRGASGILWAVAKQLPSLSEGRKGGPWRGCPRRVPASRLRAPARALRERRGRAQLASLSQPGARTRAAPVDLLRSLGGYEATLETAK